MHGLRNPSIGMLALCILLGKNYKYTLVFTQTSWRIIDRGGGFIGHKLQSHSVWQRLSHRSSYWVGRVSCSRALLFICLHNAKHGCFWVKPHLLGICGGCTVGRRRRSCHIWLFCFWWGPSSSRGTRSRSTLYSCWGGTVCNVLPAETEHTWRRLAFTRNKLRVGITLIKHIHIKWRWYHTVPTQDLRLSVKEVAGGRCFYAPKPKLQQHTHIHTHNFQHHD